MIETLGALVRRGPGAGRSLAADLRGRIADLRRGPGTGPRVYFEEWTTR